jgi:hypothetical protein
MLLRCTQPDFAQIGLKIARGGGSVTDVELYQYTCFLMARFAHWEDTFYQHKARLMTNEAFRTAVGLMRNSMTDAANQVAWRRSRSIYEPDYRAFVDSIAEEVQVSPYDEALLDQWKMEIAAEMATAAEHSRHPGVIVEVRARRRRLRHGPRARRRACRR